MNAIIIYYSLTGRTAQAAKYIKKGLEMENVVVTSMNVHKAQIEDLTNKDLIIFGSPVHMGSPALELRRFLNKLPEESLKGRKVSSFVTYTFLEGTALSTIEELVRDKGATDVIPGLARPGGIVRMLLNMITGSTLEEEAWIAFGQSIV